MRIYLALSMECLSAGTLWFRPALWPLIVATFIAAAAGCTSESRLPKMEQVMPASATPAPEPKNVATGADVTRGKYLVELLGCGVCHTDGALTGNPDTARLLAGSGTGIAYTSPLDEKHPGVVFPANLTPDDETGIGRWNTDEVVELLRTGEDRAGRRHLPVMPWPVYNRLSAADANAIAAYLLSLTPVRHKVPDNVVPGRPSRAPYVHFGIYRSGLDQ